MRTINYTPRVTTRQREEGAGRAMWLLEHLLPRVHREVDPAAKINALRTFILSAASATRALHRLDMRNVNGPETDEARGQERRRAIHRWMIETARKLFPDQHSWEFNEDPRGAAAQLVFAVAPGRPAVYPDSFTFIL